MRIHRLVLLAGAGLAGCTHVPLDPAALDAVQRPALVSRIDEGAGPRATVYRDEPSFRPTQPRISQKEADRRLQVKLAQGATRFQVSERIRAGVMGLLPQVPPWSNAVPPAKVASALESFLVENVPENQPDYELLKSLGADAVVEFVVQEYGMHADHGRAGAYARGYGHMFLFNGDELWHADFNEDQLRGATSLDPAQVKADPTLFRDALGALLNKVAADFARDLAAGTRMPKPKPVPGS